jgi:ribonuclease R
VQTPEVVFRFDGKGGIAEAWLEGEPHAHMLVEELMILANEHVGAFLSSRNRASLYRVHERPDPTAVEHLLAKLVDLGVPTPPVPKRMTPQQAADLAGAVSKRVAAYVEQSGRGREAYPALVLRALKQARYDPRNLGHSGLASRAYAHFTSPIRRYADLLVHRGLVSAYRLGEGGLPPADAEKFDEIGEQISRLERRAMEAERETVDRYVAAYLADQIGQVVLCRITGVQPFGFFATVVGFGGDGLVPVSTIGDEYFRYDEKAQQLVGEDSGTTYRQGQKLKLRIAEANPVSGSLRFELPDRQGSAPTAPQRRDRVRTGGRSGRPPNIRHSSRRR